MNTDQYLMLMCSAEMWSRSCDLAVTLHQQMRHCSWNWHHCGMSLWSRLRMLPNMLLCRLHWWCRHLTTSCRFCTLFAVITIHTHTRLTALFPGLPRWAATRKVKPIWIFLKQETVSGSSISWAICKSAPCSRQITTPAPHHSVFYRPDALPAAQPTASKHHKVVISEAPEWAWDVPSKLPPPLGGCGRPRNMWFPHLSLYPKGHLDRLFRVCRVHSCYQQTDRPSYICNNRPHLMLCDGLITKLM